MAYPLSSINEIITTADVVIGSRPSPADDCTPNCGKVLAHDRSMWVLYDPITTTWLPMPSQSDPAPTFRAANGGGSSGLTAQILTEQCLPQYCGQVLMVYPAGPNATGGPFAELWNPKTAAFTPLGYVVPSAPSDGYSVTALRDGKVLITAAGSDTIPTRPKWTRIFNPMVSDPAKVFEYQPDHVLRHRAYGAAVLNSGKVLFTEGNGYGPGAEVFDGTSWQVAPSCGGANDFCQILTAFDDGKQVLAGSGAPTEPYSTRVHTIWRLDSTGWKKTKGPSSAPPGPSSLGKAAVIGGPQCTIRCGQIVTAGGDINDPAKRSSELYIPPS